MKTVAMRSELEALPTPIPEPPRPQRLVPHRPLVKTLSGSPPSDRARLELERFVLVEPRVLLRRVRERCAASADAKRVGLTMHASAHSASVQSHAFTLAICELVENAIDASAHDQDVVVLASLTRAGDLLWQVQDDGVGMSALELDTIGEPSDDQTLDRGIVRARAIVEAHGGLIHFESTRTFGTTASVWLPHTKRSSLSGPGLSLDAGADEEFVLDSVRPERPLPVTRPGGATTEATRPLATVEAPVTVEDTRA
jgi:hypothetical protein